MKNQKAIKILQSHRDYLDTLRDTAVLGERDELWEKILHCSYCIGVLDAGN